MAEGRRASGVVMGRGVTLNRDDLLWLAVLMLLLLLSIRERIGGPSPGSRRPRKEPGGGAVPGGTVYEPGGKGGGALGGDALNEPLYPLVALGVGLVPSGLAEAVALLRRGTTRVDARG